MIDDHHHVIGVSGCSVDITKQKEVQEKELLFQEKELKSQKLALEAKEKELAAEKLNIELKKQELAENPLKSR